ncbi:MAG: TolC family protein [Rhodobacteraceae bacterium]|jgi:adhesin transport system outer membrane protein|nr:TolC family protein [Paracoccaceae bacterium]
MKFPCRVKARAGRFVPVLALASACLLAGCMGGDEASKSASDPARAPVLDGKGQVVSSLIGELRQRRTILAPGTAFSTVAEAIMTAGASSAESELRVKRLTAKARSKNWLPSIGPDVSLTSLGELAARMLLDQTVFDNGRRRAERDFAAADVEVAAVSLATELNQQVHDGLKLYLEARRATELAAITDTALVRMADFERIMRIRHEGGLADGSDYRVITQKQAEMQATLSSEREGAASAWAELAAMTKRPMEGITGLSDLPPDQGQPQPLSVLLARGEAARTAAEVRVARAGLFLGIGAKASLERDGGLDAGLKLDGNGFGFGRGDNMKALAETEEAARRRVDEAARDADRRIVALGREIAELNAEQAQNAKILAEMEANLILFTEQYRAGGRSLIDLVDQFEAVVAMKRGHASLKYQIAQARLDIALLRGVLVDGAQM